jgi:hypothetical protein
LQTKKCSILETIIRSIELLVAAREILALLIILRVDPSPRSRPL